MGAYVPDELLSRLIGYRMYSVEFVLNDYVQFRFDREDSSDAPFLNCDVWPVVEREGHEWREPDLGYADVLRRLTPGIVTSTAEATGLGLIVELDTGVLSLHPTRDEVYVEIAMLSGLQDGQWMCWRPGEDSFEDLG